MIHRLKAGLQTPTPALLKNGAQMPPPPGSSRNFLLWSSGCLEFRQVFVCRMVALGATSGGTEKSSRETGTDRG